MSKLSDPMGLAEQDFIVQLKAGVVRCRCPTTYGVTAQFLFVVVFFATFAPPATTRDGG